MFIFYFLSLLFGASIGSFVQVVATRLHVAPILKGRSKCLSCGEALRVIDLIPIFSYISLKGRCRYCKSFFGVSALIIEGLYGLVFVLLYHFILSSQVSLVLAFLWLVYYTLLFGTLGIIALYDRAHMYIPIMFLFFYGFLTLLMLVVRYMHEPSWIILLGPVIVALPFLIVWLVTRGKGLGFGDILLFLGVGAFFGVNQGMAVLLISIWAGALYGLYVKYISGRNKGKVTKGIAIPFVPFIVFAFIFVLFTDIDVFSIATLFT